MARRNLSFLITVPAILAAFAGATPALAAATPSPTTRPHQTQRYCPISKAARRRHPTAKCVKRPTRKHTVRRESTRSPAPATAGGLVVGLPLNMDGSDGPSAQSARAFGRNWVNRSPLPLIFWDERLSTMAVTRTLLDADASRKKRSEVVDKMAAAYILQIALDRLRR